MKKQNLIIAILLLVAIILLFLILEPALNGQGAELPPEGESPPAALSVRESDQLFFNLKYTRYQEGYPYQYEYRGEIRPYRFREMIETAGRILDEQEKGSLTFLDNYKDRKGKAPLYHGKATDRDGTLRGAAVPGYPDPADQEEFDYLPDGTLVRIMNPKETGYPENPVGSLTDGFLPVWSLTDQKAYWVPEKYVRQDRQMERIKKVIAIDRTNQTIAALEQVTRLEYFQGPGVFLKTDWQIVSYSRCTTGKLGPYHQPTPVGTFYAMEKKPYLEYLIDGTNQIGGREPWAIRFTAGAYVHGMSAGEFSEAIGTVPLSHKCVRNYTSHALFLYEWFEEDRTAVIVIE